MEQRRRQRHLQQHQRPVHHSAESHPRSGVDDRSQLETDEHQHFPTEVADQATEDDLPLQVWRVWRDGGPVHGTERRRRQRPERHHRGGHQQPPHPDLRQGGSLQVPVWRVRQTGRPAALPEPRCRGTNLRRHHRNRTIAHTPNPDLQPVRPVCAQVRRQHPAAPARRHRRQQGPHRRRRVQSDARHHLRPVRQRPAKVRLQQTPRVPQRRRRQRQAGNLHLRQPGALRQGVQLRGPVPAADRRRGHHQLPDRRRHQRQRRDPDRRQPQQLQPDHLHPGRPARVRAREQGQARPVLRRGPHGRRQRRAGQQGLPAVHLPVRASAADRLVKG
uniref:(northern house mosquito) hypothetical protein n=1 Tax=Culex pipiens TaxID=7175 RepID=A0A8D8JIN2_CULPI